MNISTYCGQVEMYTNRFRNEKFEAFGPNFDIGVAENGIIFAEKVQLMKLPSTGAGVGAGAPPILPVMKSILHFNSL